MNIVSCVIVQFVGQDMARFFIVLAALFLALPAMAKDYPDTDCEKDEKVCLKVLDAVANRSGDELILNFENRENFHLKSSNKNCDEFDIINCVGYFIKGVYKNHVFIISYYYEGGAIRIFRVKDGKSMSLPGVLIMSPSKTRFLSASDPYSDGPSPQIYRFINNSIKVEYKFKQKIDLFDSEINWNGDKKLIVKCFSTEKSFAVSLSQAGWSEPDGC